MGTSSNSTKSAFFKKVPGGWIFRSPNPWVFGDTPHYLVNDAQKAQIAAIVVPRRPVVFAVMLVAGILVWAVVVSTFMWAFSGHEDPTLGDLAKMVVLIIIPMLAILPVAALIQRHRLAPVLAEAPLTNERISYAELRQNVEAATPLKQLINACIASVFACFAGALAVLTHLATRHFVFDGYVTVWGFVTITFGVVSVVWYRRCLRKAAELETSES
jgi:hypothetical protein